MSDPLFFTERVWPCHAGGYWWSAEALELAPGVGVTFNESALATAPFKWLATKRIRRAKRRFEEERSKPASRAKDHAQSRGGR